MAKTPTRLYKLTVKGTDGAVTQRLVEATTPASAIRHVAREMIEVEVASPRDCVSLTQNGAKVEQAWED